MSVKAKIAAVAATFALAGSGLGAAGTLSASAATPPCGPQCANLSTLKFGPSFILEKVPGRTAAGQELILSIASNSDPAEDFVAIPLGLVSTLPTSGKDSITPQFATRYGTLKAGEYEYEPLGVPSHLCASTWPGQIAQPGYKVRLEPCDKYSNSIWAVGRVTLPTGTARKHYAVNDSYYVAVNAATNSVSDPLVLTYPAGYPTDTPRPLVDVEPLNVYTDMVVFDSQQWTYSLGPVHSIPQRSQ